MQNNLCLAALKASQTNPPLVEDDPLTGDCKDWSGGQIRHPRKCQKSKFVIESL